MNRKWTQKWIPLLLILDVNFLVLISLSLLWYFLMMEANNNSIRDYNKEPTKIGGVQRKVLHVEEDKSKQNCLNIQRYYHSNMTIEPFLFQFRDREAAVAHCPQIWKPQKSSAQVSMRKAAR
ncbi:hypothetical protein T06_5892 [Trichinella sp. T6]|nr:hypothetical protein T06_5892 [Trichinella sp. T6]